MTARTLYRGANIIPGDGSVAFTGSIAVQDGLITAIGTDLEAAPGDEMIDLAGASIMPTLIDVHGHAGYLKGHLAEAANYSRENVLDHLRRLAYHGVSVFQSLGTDRDDTELTIRDQQRSGELDDPSLATLLTAGAGIAAPTPGQPNGGAFFATDIIQEAGSPEDARRIVRELAAKRPDILKIWIDDRDGTKEKLLPEVYRAIVDEAREVGLRAVAHVFTLDDAKAAARAGVAGIAHTVREPGTDDELLELMVQNGVTGFSSISIQRGGLFGYDWLDDPLLVETISEETRTATREMLEAIGSSMSSSFTQDGYRILEDNIRRYHEAGVRTVLSGDTGLLGNYFGFAEHRELEAIANSGVGPAAAIVAGTSAGAEFLGLTDRGVLAPGKRADLLILEADPLADIRNTRMIKDVIIAGQRLDRAALRATFQ